MSPRQQGRYRELPEWAIVTSSRREHIKRVVRLLDKWARRLRLPPDRAAEWHDAGMLHDALRDAPEGTLRAILPDSQLAASLLHGPASAALLRQEGEQRAGLLNAVEFHTIGSADWDSTGRALYCADFLEPGRSFDRERRAALAARFAKDPEDVLKEVVRMRLTRALDSERRLHPETVRLWNSLV